ncbi:MAG: gluconate 2-dehydrogenase subunit 3 family protein [Gemmatimonadaceae bacterium]|nr:gluconate 2-dehydrogenase subunit 3 family protein [Gemmatimonadaceae bacterium]
MAAMNRREAVKAAGTLLGGVVVLGALPGCGPRQPAATPDSSKVVISGCCSLAGADEDLLVAFADTLLPDTPASPGARTAGCGPIMNMLLSECYDAASHKAVMEGIVALRTRAYTFETMARPDRERLLTEVHGEAERAGKTHWFHALRDLAQRAYFASETGTTKALRYVMEPGGFKGCVTLAPGQPAWA